MKIINLNDKVRVQLTDLGRELYKKDHMQFMEEHDFEPKEEDSKGWSEWQLWNLMEIFGAHVSMGQPLPFNTTIEIVDLKITEA